jgi:hypothetical protein
MRSKASHSLSGANQAVAARSLVIRSSNPNGFCVEEPSDSFADTVALGGLIADRASKTGRGIPALRQILVVGFLLE